MNTKLDVLHEVLELESRCVLSYVVNLAWPSEVDQDDVKAKGIFEKAWADEAVVLDRLIELVLERGGDPNVHGTYRFAPVRLNFARWSHLLESVPPLIEDEITALESLRAEVDDGSEESAILADLERVKEEGLGAIVAEAERLRVAREKAQEASEGEGEAEAPAGAGGAVDGEHPWRDADMPLEERLEAAKNASLEDKLWAAMAQTDCTACGYDCEGYAKAIASGEESDLTKCVPGEDDTANALKKLLGKA